MLPAQAHVVTAAVKTLNTRRPYSCAASAARGRARWGPARSMPMQQESPIGRSSCARRTWWRPGGPNYGRFSSGHDRDPASWKSGGSCSRIPGPSRGSRLGSSWGRRLPRNGPYWRAAAVKDRRGVLRCPDCGAQLREKANGEGGFLSRKDLERSRKRCHREIIVDFDKDGNPVTRPCGAAIVAIRRRPDDLGAGRLHPQAHERACSSTWSRRDPRGESRYSARANALGALVASCRKVIGDDGNPYRRQGESRRSLLFRLSPTSLKAENLSPSVQYRSLGAARCSRPAARR